MTTVLHNTETPPIFEGIYDVPEAARVPQGCYAWA